MENLVKALQIVLSTCLIARTDSDLAAILGYKGKGRTTIDRIRHNMVGRTALANFCIRLSNVLNITEETILKMAYVVSSTSEFSQIIKNHFDRDDPDSPFKVLYSFISHDFSFFDKEFQEITVNDILSVEHREPKVFYQVLSYFYIKASGIDFYKKNITHNERCSSIIESLGQRLIMLYPENGLATASVYGYSISKIHDKESPTLWSLIEAMSVMLRFFAHPIDTLKSESAIRRLTGIGGRAYWKGKDPEDVILTWYIPGSLSTNGHYEVLKINRETYRLENTASLTLIGYNKVSIFSKPGAASEFGTYSWDGIKLRFKWNRGNDDLTHVGNSWELQLLNNSQSLRHLDRHISDADIMQEILRSEGFESEISLQLSDVILSRGKCTLAMKSSQRYSVDISEFRFLKSITPADPIIICRLKKDDTIYVIWPTLQQAIPFD